MIPPTPSFSIRRPVQQQKKMSITQTYYLAHTARGKLSKEADRADHDLRLLVGHANLLDSLMLDLANAEKEQEHWFNQTVRSAAKSTRKDRHVQWADAVIEDEEEDFSDSDSSSDSDSDYFEEEEEEEEEDESHLRRASAPITVITEHEVSDEDEEDTDRLTLTRSPSRQSPPELLDDLSSDSDEDSMPPSPESVTMNTFGASGKEPSLRTVAMFHPVKRAAMPFADSDRPQIVQEGHNYSTMIPAY